MSALLGFLAAWVALALGAAAVWATACECADRQRARRPLHPLGHPTRHITADSPDEAWQALTAA